MEMDRRRRVASTPAGAVWKEGKYEKYDEKRLVKLGKGKKERALVENSILNGFHRSVCCPSLIQDTLLLLLDLDSKMGRFGKGNEYWGRMNGRTLLQATCCISRGSKSMCLYFIPNIIYTYNL
jgi:hypothetical protein